DGVAMLERAFIESWLLARRSGDDQNDVPAVLGLSNPETMPQALDRGRLESLPESAQSADDRHSLASALMSKLASVKGTQWLTVFALAYMGASAFLLGRWLLGHFALWRLLRAAQPAPDEINRVFETMAQGPGRRPRLLVSARVRVPLSCGLVRPCVVVPASLCEPNASPTLRWLFAHELTHLERGDAWACLLFGLGQV